MKTRATGSLVSPLRAHTGERVTEFPLRNTRTNYDTYTSFNTLSIADTANFNRGTGTYGAKLPLTDYYLNKNKDNQEDMKDETQMNNSSFKNPYAEHVSTSHA